MRQSYSREIHSGRSRREPSKWQDNYQPEPRNGGYQLGPITEGKEEIQPNYQPNSKKNGKSVSFSAIETIQKQVIPWEYAEQKIR